MANRVNCYKFEIYIPNEIKVIEILMLVVKYYIIINNNIVYDVNYN